MDITQFASAGHLNRLSWNGDNREFVVEILLPELRPPAAVSQVLRWAYGYDGSGRSWEHESDGSTAVPNAFMLGLIKEPPGVGHDYLNRVSQHVTPDGHRWTAAEANAWYRRALIVFGYSRARAWIRWLGLTISTPFWWR